MGRFDSPWQVAHLFLCAAVVSVAIIFVLRLEAHKRYGEDEEKVQDVNVVGEAARAGESQGREVFLM